MRNAMTIERNDILAVIPTYNNEKTLARVIGDVRRYCTDVGGCMRESLVIPSGERYELCRSVHAEANAIISASRRDMVGGTLYLVGRNAQTGELLPDATSCPMCRRHSITAGRERVVIRHTPTEFQVVDVQDWIDSEDDVPQA